MFLIVMDEVRGERMINVDKVKSVQPFVETEYKLGGGFVFNRSLTKTVVEYVDGTADTLNFSYEELKSRMVGEGLVLVS